jgi:hypothetical protein
MNKQISFPPDPKLHLTPGPLPHFVAEREKNLRGGYLTGT